MSRRGLWKTVWREIWEHINDPETIEFLSAIIGLLAAVFAYFIARSLVGSAQATSVFAAIITGVVVFLAGIVTGRLLMWKDAGSPRNRIKLAAWILYAPLIGLSYLLMSNLGFAIATASLIVYAVWVFGHVWGGVANWRKRGLEPTDELLERSRRLEQDVLSLIERYRGRMPDDWIDELRDLATHNECGVAIENLSIQIGECDLDCSGDELAEMKRLGKLMRLNPEFYEWFESSSDAGVSLER